MVCPRNKLAGPTPPIPLSSSVEGMTAKDDDDANGSFLDDPAGGDWGLPARDVMRGACKTNQILYEFRL